MTKTLKVVLITSVCLLVTVGGVIIVGLYAMEIEDTYGDNQEIFYSAREGDIVINHNAKEWGKVTKTWTRFYVLASNNDTLDISEWWDDADIEIYRLVNKNLSLKSMNYENRDEFEENLKLVKKLR